MLRSRAASTLTVFVHPPMGPRSTQIATHSRELQPELRPRRLIDAAIVIALIAATIVCYWSVRGHDFINFDDETYLLEQPEVRNGLTWSNVKWAFTTFANANWHPLTWLSYMLDAQIFGLDRPGGFLITNLIIHAINAALLFAVLRTMTGSQWRSALVAALFALHPLHVESVAWVSERKDVLSTMFGLLAMWAYASYARQPGVRKYLIVASLFALSLLAKPMLVTLPFVLLLLDFWPLRRFSLLASGFWIRDSRRVFNVEANEKPRIRNPISLDLLCAEKLPLLLMSAASSVVTVFAQKHSGAVQPLENLSFGRRVANAAVSYVMYLLDMLWPANLLAMHRHPGTIASWKVILALAALLIITGVCAWQIRKRPHLIVGWLWYLGTLVPVIGLVQVGGQARADRYTYIPLIGVFIMLSWLLPDRERRMRLGRAPVAAIAAIALAVLAALGILTARQCGIWKDSATFWNANIERGSESPFAYNNRGVIRTREGRYAEAEADFLKAIEIERTHAEAYMNLGVVYGKQGRDDDALELYAKAVRIKPDLAPANYYTGNIHKMRRDFKMAIGFYKAALASQPDYAEAHGDLGGSLYFLNQLDEAEVHLRRAIELNPNLLVCYNNLGRVLVTKGNRDEGIAILKAGLKVNPEYAPIREILEQLEPPQPVVQEVPDPFTNPPPKSPPKSPPGN